MNATFAYSLSSTNTDNAPFASLDTNAFVANCATGTPGSADMDASWDKVFLLFQPS